PPAYSGSQLSAKKGHPFSRDRVRRRRQIPPDARGGGNLLDAGAKTLNHQPAIVAGALDGWQHFVPMHLTRPGNPAIALAGVNVMQAIATGKDGRRRILLLNVCVEGVEEDAQLRVLRFFTQAKSLGGCGSEIGFKAVERLM